MCKRGWDGGVIWCAHNEVLITCCFLEKRREELEISKKNSNPTTHLVHTKSFCLPQSRGHCLSTWSLVAVVCCCQHNQSQEGRKLGWQTDNVFSLQGRVWAGAGYNNTFHFPPSGISFCFRQGRQDKHRDRSTTELGSREPWLQREESIWRPVPGSWLLLTFSLEHHSLRQPVLLCPSSSFTLASFNMGRPLVLWSCLGPPCGPQVFWSAFSFGECMFASFTSLLTSSTPPRSLLTHLMLTWGMSSLGLGRVNQFLSYFKFCII